jgi:hypothetical protein
LFFSPKNWFSVLSTVPPLPRPKIKRKKNQKKENHPLKPFNPSISLSQQKKGFQEQKPPRERGDNSPPKSKPP